VFIRGAERKISTIVDIYAQVSMVTPEESGALKVLGKCETAVNEYHAVKNLSLLRQVPSDSIVRYILKISAIVSEIAFMKIAFKCDQCREELQNENVCTRGCAVNKPKMDL
jgi:hypothetical protein